VAENGEGEIVSLCCYYYYYSLLNFVWIFSVSPGKLKGPDVVKQGLAAEVTT
jgi:hypothetical protein